MNWIAILFAAELGILPLGNLAPYGPTYFEVASAGNYYADFGVRVIFWDTIYLGGRMKNYFVDDPDSYTFIPIMAFFPLEAGLQHKGFSIGFRRNCIHPYIPARKASVDLFRDGNYEELFIRFEAQIGGKH